MQVLGKQNPRRILAKAGQNPVSAEGRQGRGLGQGRRLLDRLLWASWVEVVPNPQQRGASHACTDYWNKTKGIG